jgi:hypothetical protein
VSPLKKVARPVTSYILAYNNNSFGTGYYERKVDKDGTTTWKVRSLVSSASLAGSGCFWPKLQQDITTMPVVSKNGVVTVPKSTILIGKAYILDGKGDENECADNETAAWKKGMAKAKKYVNSQ